MKKTSAADKYTTIDEYIRLFPAEVQNILQTMRQVIRESAPEAKETINYQIPTFKLNGNLVHFAAFEGHIGFYPGPQAIQVFGEALSQYDTSKGTIRFPIHQPIPLDLVKRIVEFRVRQNLKK